MYLGSKCLSFVKEKLFISLYVGRLVYFGVEDAKELFSVLVKVLSF